MRRRRRFREIQFHQECAAAGYALRSLLRREFLRVTRHCPRERDDAIMNGYRPTRIDCLWCAVVARFRLTGLSRQSVGAVSLDEQNICPLFSTRAVIQGD